jgi:hypothetical protein
MEIKCETGQNDIAVKVLFKNKFARKKLITGSNFYKKRYLCYAALHTASKTCIMFVSFSKVN